MPGSLHTIWSYSSDNPLLFTQMYFWVFLMVVLLFYALVYRRFSLRHLYLFLVSLFFYYKAGGLFFVLLLISVTVDYLAGRGIHNTHEQWKKKGWIAFSLLINLSLLAYFKYTFFFVDILNRLTGWHIVPRDYLAVLSNTWFHTRFDVSSIFLPIGISFYTFQTISYTVDIFRKQVKPVKRFTDFAFYVTFFPQLVAGPIVRAAQFIPQLARKYSLTKQQFGHALFLILTGLIKKIVIADFIAVNFVDRVFSHPAAFGGFENIMAAYGYAVQIYCDFSGYTDIAIGVALLFGFRIPLNFNAPYKAVTLTGFWRRWHISLSSWLRDYLYIPMGGNRKGKPRMYVNVLVTMILGGLWHGANYRFLIWGGFHGAGLVVEKMLGIPERVNQYTARWKKILFTLLTFHFVVFLWIFFRSENMEIAQAMIFQIIHQFHLTGVLKVVFAEWSVFLLILAALVIHWLPAQWQENVRGGFIRMPLFIKFLVTVMVVFLIIGVKSAGFRPFIYFQF